MTHRSKSVASALLAILLAGIVASSCISFDEERLVIVDANGNPAIEHLDELSKASFHYVESGNPEGSAIVFIHGTPGSYGFFSGYIADAQLSNTRNITIDRPGWGASIVKTELEPTLSFQSAVLGDWLCKIKQQSPKKKLLIVAHSYGATLTPRLAMDHPQCISGALLLAGGADPALTAPRWYNNLSHYPPVSWLIQLSSWGLKKSNNEMMTVKSELIKIQDRWKELSLPVTVIQGEDDGLVHPDNADYIETKLAHIPAKIIRIEDAGHVLRESHRELIMNEIHQLLEAL
ncbi:MAG: alpha/beta fold hydrolase [Pseudohongiellaceae bacterium]